LPLKQANARAKEAAVLAAKKEEAQQVVDSMSEGNGTQLTKEDEAEVKKALDKSSKEEPPSTAGDERRAWRGIEGALLGNDKSASKSRQIMAQTEPVVETAESPASLLEADHMQDLSMELATGTFMELATGAFNLSKVVVVLLWLLFISSTIAVIAIIVLSLNNIVTELALWMQIAGYTFWYSGIALAFKGLYDKFFSRKGGWKSQGPTARNQTEAVPDEPDSFEYGEGEGDADDFSSFSKSPSKGSIDSGDDGEGFNSNGLD